MPWFVVDDQMWAHPKFQWLSDKAIALWVRAGSHCSMYLTDGHVSPGTIRMFGATRKTCSELVAAGLWHDAPEGGYVFHDWPEYQRTAEWWKAKREGDKKRQQKRRANAGRNPVTGQYAPGIHEPPDED